MKRLFLIYAFTFSALAMGQVDITKSKFTWTGTKVTGKHYGELALKSAKLNFDDKNRISKGEFVIDLASLTVSDLQGEWAQKFIGHMKSEDFFNIKKYPTAKLVVLRDTGKSIEGNLTIKDKTNRVIIPYRKEEKTYVGALKFDRTKFDMKYGSGSFFKGLGDKMIHDQVTLDFKVVLK